MKRIAMVVVDRANWGRLEPLATKLRWGDDFDLHIVAVAGVAMEPPHCCVHEVHHVVSGDDLQATSRTIGYGVAEFANAFEKVRLDERSPGYGRLDIVLIIGDRREALAAAIAAAHSGAKLVHLQGGETSGTLDQKYRWAITALADYHVPATLEAKDAIIDVLAKSSEYVNPFARILATGCPSSDLAREVLADKPARTPEVLVCYHPNTCHPETAAAEAEALFSSLPADRPITVLSTNPDAGRGPIVEACKRHGYAMVSLEPREFARRLATCSLAVGNSSGFVRDSGFYGTPVVLVGDRQNGRERSENVMQVACVKGEIEAGIEWQLEHGPYPPSDLYGDGHVCERIVEALRKLWAAAT